MAIRIEPPWRGRCSESPSGRVLAAASGTSNVLTLLARHGWFGESRLVLPLDLTGEEINGRPYSHHRGRRLHRFASRGRVAAQGLQGQGVRQSFTPGTRP